VLQKEEHSCPACKIGTLRKIKGTAGPFWGCSRYKEECKFTAPDKKGNPDLSADKSKPQSTNEFFCTDCNKPLIHRHKAGKDGYDFWGCSGFKDGCRKSFKNKAGKPEF
ncbi:MAG TPA: topoisomerase DNA-binding C4 zinc finger domain-containing protein, partial [Dyadobacter sp.]|nr:topoisomerase DNA-binding C4 zinc finger domain-containing protein [Dyadobacter sp.]